MTATPKLTNTLKGYKFFFMAVLHLAVLMVSNAFPASAQEILTVTTTADSSAEGVQSLRNAIARANENDATTTINFSLPQGSTIRLNSEIVISKRAFGLTINGPGVFELTLDGQGRNRIFRVDLISQTNEVIIRGMRLTNGRGDEDGGGAILYSQTPERGTLIIDDCVIEGNSADDATIGGGGAIANSGHMEISNSRISGNFARASRTGGGGIYSKGAITLRNVTVERNFVAGSSPGGGGISNGGFMDIRDSEILNNFANGATAGGGGILNFNGTVVTAKSPNAPTHTTIVNSTIAENSASQSCLAEQRE